MLTTQQEEIVKKLVDSLETANTPIPEGLFSDIVSECSNRQKALDEIAITDKAFIESRELIIVSDCKTLSKELSVLGFTCRIMNESCIQIIDSRKYIIANLYYNFEIRPNHYYDSYYTDLKICYNPSGNKNYVFKNLEELIPHLKPVLKTTYENLNLKR